MAPNGPAWIEALFGIVAAGGVVMPIDVQMPDEDLQRMLAIGECRLVIAGARQIERLRSLAPLCGVVDIDAAGPEPQLQPSQAGPDALVPPSAP